MAKKILLADDSITIQKVISITFASEDYELVIVGDGESALRKMRDSKPDLVLADVAMPGKNGYEVSEAMKNDPALKNIPLILLAGTFEPLNKEEAARVKADDSIIKPFESQELIDKVKRLLSIREEAGKKPAPGVEEPLGEELFPSGGLLPEPKLEIAEDIWEGGDFLGLPEDFEKSPKEEQPDLSFLSSGLFEEAGKDLSAEGDFTDLVIQEEELKPEAPEKAETKETPGPEPSVRGPFRADFERKGEEPKEAFVVEPFEVEPFKGAEKFEPAKTEPFEVEPLDVEPFKPEAFEREPEVKPFPFRAPAPTQELEEPLKVEAQPEPVQEAKDEGPTQIEFVEEPSEPARPFEPYIPEKPAYLRPVEYAQPAPEYRKAEAPAPPAQMISEAQVDRIIEEVAGKADSRIREEVNSRLSSGSIIPRDEVQAIVSRVAREVVEEIAWEVVPEIAEELIKAEISKFKEALSRLK